MIFTAARSNPILVVRTSIAATKLLTVSRRRCRPTTIYDVNEYDSWNVKSFWSCHKKYLCSSSNRNTPITTTSRLVKKRKAKILSKPLNEIVTTKDKLRSLIETNRIVGTKDSTDSFTTLKAPATELLDLASSRLAWVRNKVYQYWNPDYTEEPNIGRAKTAALSDDTSEYQIRTYRGNGIIMDTRWWIWNILFALLPAICISLYCEFRGKYILYRYHHQIEIQEIKKILQEHEFTIERANAIIAARDKDDELNPKSRTGDLDEEFVKWMFDKVKVLYYIGINIVQQIQEQIFLNNNNNTSSVNSDVSTATSTNQNTQSKETTDNSNRITSHPGNQQSPQVDIETRSKNDIGVPSSSLPSITVNTTKDLSIESLYQRIQQLEAQIQRQSYDTTPSTTGSDTSVITPEIDDQEAIRVIGQRMKHMSQSSIHNRHEIDAKQKWIKYIDVTPDTTTAATNESQSNQQQSQSESYISKLQQFTVPLLQLLYNSNNNNDTIHEPSQEKPIDQIQQQTSLPVVTSPKQTNDHEIQQIITATGGTSTVNSINHVELSSIIHEQEQQKQNSRPWWKFLWRAN